VGIYSSSDPLECIDEKNVSRRIFVRDLVTFMEDNVMYRNSYELIKIKYGIE